MNILAVDTALGACSAAVLSDGRVLAREWQAMARGHAEALAPMAERVMKEAKLAFADLDRLGVTTGPGTFTGQRVGLAFMRAVRVAVAKPLIGVTTMDAMAAQILEETDAPWALVAHDARREEAYLGARARAGDILQAPIVVALDDVAAKAAEIAARAGARFAFGGTAAQPLRHAFARTNLPPIFSPVAQPDAVFVAKLAMALPAPAEPPSPLYLREADAKLPTPKAAGLA